MKPYVSERGAIEVQSDGSVKTTSVCKNAELNRMIIKALKCIELTRINVLYTS